MNKLLTISIPTWNRASLVSNLLSELTQQISSFHLENDIEILVSNNDSKDNTEEVIKSFISKCNYIKYNKNHENIGGKSNVLKSMEMASSEFILFLGDDDRIRKNSLPEIINILKSKTDIGVVIDISNAKVHPDNTEGPIAINQLLKNYLWNIGNAGIFISRTSFIRDNLKKYGYDFFNEFWPQTQIIILGLTEHNDLKIYIDKLNIISESLHIEVMIYNSYYLWKTTYFELFLAIEKIKTLIEKETYSAGRRYLKNNIPQLLFNVLQCGVFIDEKEVRVKTKKDIKKNIGLFSFYEKIYLALIIFTLSIPNALSKSLSDIFIYLIRGKRGIKKKNDFVNSEKLKKEKASKQRFSEIRKPEFEKENY